VSSTLGVLLAHQGYLHARCAPLAAAMIRQMLSCPTGLHCLNGRLHAQKLSQPRFCHVTHPAVLVQLKLVHV
jgi:hypothetical protein